MNIVLVGRSNGRREIRWGAAFILACALGVFCAAVAAVTYYAFSGQFSFLATAIGFIGPFITIGIGIQQALRLPIERLTPLNRTTV
jgi:hypothetical protein